MQLSIEIWDNKDDIQETVKSLHNFTLNWCLNCKETKNVLKETEINYDRLK